MVGCVNAVNLTDGIDGLATGVTIPVMAFFTLVSIAAGQMNLALFPAALLGGLGAFLTYNFHPAKAFMGDTGSLFLGGAVCGLAFALDIPLVLILVGLVYLVETLSDIIQVVYFKLTHGKRIFKMAPIHHHFEMCGWSEEKDFYRFCRDYLPDVRGGLVRRSGKIRALIHGATRRSPERRPCLLNRWTREADLQQRTDDRGMMDVPFLVLVLLLVAIGLLMMFSASYVRANYETEIPCTILSARRDLRRWAWLPCSEPAGSAATSGRSWPRSFTP